MPDLDVGQGAIEFILPWLKQLDVVKRIVAGNHGGDVSIDANKLLELGLGWFDDGGPGKPVIPAECATRQYVPLRNLDF